MLELRPAHDPDATWGFVGVVVSTQDLSASVWRWHRENGSWTADKVITIVPEPATRIAAPCTEALCCRPTPDHRYQPVGGRSAAGCVVLRHR
ncbi:MAG: selenium-binding protein SBP56-related protein [Pseudonocardiaceae bacterium]